MSSSRVSREEFNILWKLTINEFSLSQRFNTVHVVDLILRPLLIVIRAGRKDNESGRGCSIFGFAEK